MAWMSSTIEVVSANSVVPTDGRREKGSSSGTDLGAIGWSIDGALSP